MHLETAENSMVRCETLRNDGLVTSQEGDVKVCPLVCPSVM
jgi:hypothetical protein